MNELGLFALIVLAGMTFPLAFWMARVCLAGVFSIIESDDRRRRGEAPRRQADLQPRRAS